MHTNHFFNLQMFAEGAASGPSGDGGTGANNPAAAEQNAENTDNLTGTGMEGDTGEESWDDLIKGRYKEDFHKSTQKIIDKRFRETKALEKKVGALESIAAMVAERYGVDAANHEEILRSIENDEAYYEQEAIEKGLSVQQLKEFKKLERENAKYRRDREASEREQAINDITQRWQQQTEEARQFYPGLDFDTEIQNKDFEDLLMKGLSVGDAYLCIHRDEVLGGVMQHTAEQTRKKVTNDIAARGKRPAENGTVGSRGVAMRTDVNSMTRKEREDLERRAMRGERIVL